MSKKRVVINELDGVASSETWSALNRRFLQEGKMLSELNHKYIVKCIDIFEENNTEYYVTKYAGGVNLHDYQEESTRFANALRISEQRSITIIKLIAEALDYLHKHGICHLDVIPSNIMYKHIHNEWYSSDIEPDSITLLDFGCARCYNGKKKLDIVEFSTGIGHFAGMPGYAPLELGSPNAIFSPATDIYMLGATWHFLLTGKHPPHAADVLYNGGIYDIPDVSSKVNNAIRAAMNPVMKHRPQSISEFLTLFGEKLEEPSVGTSVSGFEFEAETVNEPQQALAIDTELVGPSYIYIIKKVLGQGGFGITYLASVKLNGSLGTLNSDIKVAVKEFYMRDYCMRDKSGSVSFPDSSKGSMSQKYAKKFVKEALHLSKLNHPNIVKVAESFEYNNTSYYVMEYLDGDCLDNYIADNLGLSEYEAIKYIRQIGDALSYMHSHELLHMDVKPKNVMLKDGHCVLIDFGLAKQYDEHGQPESSTGLGAGTAGYAPLEQMHYSDDKGFAPTIDVYALGATLYNMLTSKTPPPASIVLNDGFDRSELESVNVSNDTIDVIAMAMEPLKKKRIQTISEFLTLLPDEESFREVNHIRNLSEKTDNSENENSARNQVRRVKPVKRDFQISYSDLTFSQKNILNHFTSQLYKLPSGCYANVVPQCLFDIILDKKGENDSSNYMAAFATIHNIEKFITKMQEITSAHWRFPSYGELMAFITKDDTSGIPGKPYYVYYNYEKGTLHAFQEFGGEKGEIRNGDLYFEKYKFIIVYDSTEVDFIHPQESYNYNNFNNAYIIVDKKGLWYYGLCPVMSNNKWGIIDVQGNFIIPYTFDEEPKIGMMSYEGPGPMIPEELRIKYAKGNIIGYYRIKGNNIVEHEIARTEEQWRWVAKFT